MATELDYLSKIDLLRERMDISYESAKMALDSQHGNVIEALIQLEREHRSRREQFFGRGNEVVEKVKELLHKANVTRIRVKQDERVLLEIPVTAGVVGAMVAPQLAVLGAVTALLTKCTVEVERAPGEGVH
ncbi:MAG: DUF4342 domain-containing protein [Patescibacteria group bacterium]